jgi:hypothetical protein
MFECELCVYKTPYRSSFNAHLKSKKHAKLVEIKQENGGTRMSLCDFYKCKRCNKPYFSYSGLWGHNKQCEWKSIQITPQIQTTDTTRPQREIRNATQIFLPPPPPPPPKETEHSQIQEMYITNHSLDFNSLNPLLQLQKTQTEIHPPTHLQINSIIKGFFNNTHNKRIDTEICKEKAKEIDKRVKNIHTELQTMIESVYNYTKNKETHTRIDNPIHKHKHIDIDKSIHKHIDIDNPILVR